MPVRYQQGGVVSTSRVLVVACVAALSTAANAAVDSTWNGLAADGEFSNALNWNPQGLPVFQAPPSSDGTGFFVDGGNGFTTVNIDNNGGLGRGVAALQFNTNTASYTIGSAGANGGNTLTLAPGTTQITTITAGNSNLTETINAPLALSGLTYTINNQSADSTNKFVIGGNLTTTNAGAVTLNLGGVVGSGANQFNGAISRGGGTTSLGVTINGGTWALNGANSFGLVSQTIDTVVYTRGVLVNAATLIIGDNSALGSDALVIGNGAAVIQAGGGARTLSNTVVTNNVNGTISGSNNLTLNGLFVFGGSNTITVSNPLTTINGNIHIRDSNSGTARTGVFSGSSNVVINGAISNGTNTTTTFNGGLTYSGTSTLKLTGANTYTGTTTVNAGGILVMNGTHVPTKIDTTISGGAYTVNGTLAGTGSISPASGIAVTIGTTTGRLSPGDSTLTTSSQTGTLDITKLTMNASSFLDIQLGGATPGDGQGFYDQVNVTGTAASSLLFNANITLSLALVNDFSPTASDAYYILTRGDSNAFVNFFVGAAEGATVSIVTPSGTTTGQITYLANWTGTQAGSSLTGGNDVAIYNVASVPEPSVVGLAAGAMLLAMRRKHRA